MPLMLVPRRSAESRFFWLAFSSVLTKKEPMIEAKMPSAHSAIGIIMPWKPRPAETPSAIADSLAPA